MDDCLAFFEDIYNSYVVNNPSIMFLSTTCRVKSSPVQNNQVIPGIHHFGCELSQGLILVVQYLCLIRREYRRPLEFRFPGL